MTFLKKIISKLQMSAAQSPVSRKKQLLEKEIEYKQKSLKAYIEFINSTDDEIIYVLKAKKLTKEEEFKKCHWLQCMAIFLKSIYYQWTIIKSRFFFSFA